MRTVIVISIVFLLELALASAAYFYFAYQNTKIASQIDTMEAQIHEIGEDAVELRSMLYRVEAAKETIVNIKGNEDYFREMSTSLAFVASFLPKEIWFTKMSFSPKKLWLQGKALSVDYVSAFVARLQKSGICSQVKIHDTQKKSENTKDIYIFTASCMLGNKHA